MAVVYLMPRALHVDSSAWTLTGAASKVEAIDDPVGGPDDNTSYLELVTPDASPEQISFSFDTMPEAVAITSVVVHFRAVRTAGTVTVIPYLSIGGVDYDGAGHPLGGTYTDESESFATDPATGLAFSKATIDAMGVGLRGNSAAGTNRLTQMYLEVTFIPSAVKIGAARDVGSRLLRLFRRAIETPQIQGPLAWADMELMTDAALTHAQYPSPIEGEGAGYKPWQRAMVRLFGTSLNLDNLTVSLSGLDLRHYLCRFWDTAISTLPPGATAPGAARLDPGVTRTFSRASKAWVQNAAVAEQGDIELAEIGADVEKNETLGLLIEEARTNDLARSAFDLGVAAGWTVTGNVVDDAADLLFHPDVTAQSANFARAGSANCRLSQTTASYGGSEVLCLSAWHKDDDGQPLGWTLTRSTDGFYFNNATPGFQAGAVTNLWTVRSTPQRDQSNPITLSAAAQTLTLTHYAETVADQDNHLYQVQLEAGRFASSPIVTAAGGAVRAADSLAIENDAASGPVWIQSQGTAGATWVAPAATAAAIGDQILLAAFSEDAGSWDILRYRHADGEFQFERKVGGVTATATLAVAITAGTTYRVVGRWTGTNEEFGLAPYTLSVFVDGVKGTNAVAYGEATDGPFVMIGSDTIPADHCNGHLSHISVIPFVLADEEVPDWL